MKRWTILILGVTTGLALSYLLPGDDGAETADAGDGPVVTGEVQGAPLDEALPESTEPPAAPLVIPEDTGDDTPIPITFADLASFTYIPPDRPVEQVEEVTLDEDRERWIMNREDTGDLEVPDDQVPPDILALHGRVITIEGYLDPYTLKSDAVENFLLTQHPGGCCFGAFADMNQWIDVKAPEEMGIQLMPYTPILVTGRLTVGEVYDEYGYVLSLYRMEADGVEEVVY